MNRKQISAEDPLSEIETTLAKLYPDYAVIVRGDPGRYITEASWTSSTCAQAANIYNIAFCHGKARVDVMHAPPRFYS